MVCVATFACQPALSFVFDAMQNGATPLSYAADKGHLDVLKVLLEAGASTDIGTVYPPGTPHKVGGRPGLGGVHCNIMMTV